MPEDIGYQTYIRFTGEEADLLLQTTLRYRRKPKDFIRMVVLDWCTAAAKAGYPPLIEFVPTGIFEKGEDDA